jgi:hypothetical protein
MSIEPDFQALRGHVIAKIELQGEREASDAEGADEEQRASFVPRGELGPGSDDLPPPKPRSRRPPAGSPDDSGRYAVITGRTKR